MNIETAKSLVGLLMGAIEKAEHLGKDQVDLGAELEAADDAARTELEAAIKRVEG